MIKKTLKRDLWVPVVAILSGLFVVSCSGGEPENLVFELNIPVILKGESIETVKVQQGDMVTLRFLGEEPGEFHLHGYDIKKEIGSGEVVDLFFVADATGRFKFTFHLSGEDEHQDAEAHYRDEAHHEDAEGEIDIGFLEVRP